jgi:hypothetical protein
VVDRLPTHFNDATDRVVELIDVLWLDDNAAAAFEVERSTVIYSGLLRMSDLLVMQPNLDTPSRTRRPSRASSMRGKSPVL